MPEVPRRLQNILDRLSQTEWPVIDQVEDIDATSVARTVHSAEYVERFRKAVHRGDGLIDSADNPLCPHTWEAATGAVAAALAGVSWITTQDRGRAFVAVRPPGHHAERDTAMGFCYFNNVAIAAQHLIEQHGYKKVAIVDIDVHHGNGTQHIFEERPDVFFLSLHQFPFYPGTGRASETGKGKGVGATLNIPLKAGCGDSDYAQAFEDQVLPALHDFAPQALLISAGFDAWKNDPLGGMQVTLEGYHRWGAWLREVADQHCGGKLLAFLEGGYDLDALPDLAESFLKGIESAGA